MESPLFSPRTSAAEIFYTEYDTSSSSCISGGMASSAIPPTAATALLAPRDMATRPVRTISRMPNGRSTSSRPSILSSVPVISMISDSGATSTTRARKTCTSCSRCERFSGVAFTLIIARSRMTEALPVMLFTRSTFTSLYRLASARFAPCSSVSTTMVMRETPGLSVWPTVSDSILKARRRNSEATRFSTPGLFSTYTTKVFSIRLSVLGCLHNWTGAANHVVQIGAGRHHRVHRIFLLHLKIDQHRTSMLAGFADGRDHLGALPHSTGAHTESIRQLDEIRAQ